MAPAMCKGAALRAVGTAATAPHRSQPGVTALAAGHRGSPGPHCGAPRSIQEASSANTSTMWVLAPSAALTGLGGRRRCGLFVARATESLSSPGQPGDEASKAFAVAMAKVADETKCQDVVVLDVAPDWGAASMNCPLTETYGRGMHRITVMDALSNLGCTAGERCAVGWSPQVVSWTSFMVICTVMSKPQLLATLARVEKAAAESFGRARLNLPGSSPWETLDFGDVVLHVFTAEQRDYYDIESFYAAAEEVDLPFLTDLSAGQGSGAGAPSSVGGSRPPTWSTTPSAS